VEFAVIAGIGLVFHCFAPIAPVLNPIPQSA
jgi:hypothetical protein